MAPDVSTVDEKNTNFKTSIVELSNNSKNNIYVALGMNTPQGKRSKGWFFVKAGEKNKISVQERSTNEIYYLLMDETGKVFEQSNSSQKFELTKNASFDLATNEKGKDVEEKKFAIINPSNKKRSQLFVITGTANPKIQNE